jgi:hypothetical protein
MCTHYTSLKPDAMARARRPDDGKAHGAKRHEKASCKRIDSLSYSSQIESSLMIFVFLRSESRNISDPHAADFAQRVSRTIVRLEVTVAHAGSNFGISR